VSHPLDGARAKLGRAKEHIAALATNVRSYVESAPIRVDQREEREDQKRLIRWVATASSDPPAKLGLIVGDWANNVRAALDYTVYELVRRETNEDDPRSTQFPITTSRAQYLDQARGRLRGVPAWSLPVFEGLQPFQDGAEAPDHPLAILADVSNRDKHRLLHTAAMQVAGSQARLGGTSMWKIHGIAQNPGTVVGERVILEALIETDGDDFQIEMDIELSVALEGYEFPVVPLLAIITAEVEPIVDWFAPALE
jgi:hypothetical protein